VRVQKIKISPLLILLLSAAFATDQQGEFRIRYSWNAGILPNSKEVSLEGPKGKIEEVAISDSSKIVKICTEAILSTKDIKTLKLLASNLKSLGKNITGNDSNVVCEGGEGIEIQINGKNTAHYKPCKNKWDKLDSAYSNQMDKLSKRLEDIIFSKGLPCNKK